MAYEFPDDRYADVRSVIGLEVTEAILPDDVLALPTFEGETERYINRYITQEQMDDPIVLEQVHTAAVYYLASLVTPILPEVESERIPGGFITYAKVNLAEQAQTLHSQALDLLNEIDLGTGQPVAAYNSNVFTKAPRRYW